MLVDRWKYHIRLHVYDCRNGMRKQHNPQVKKSKHNPFCVFFAMDPFCSCSCYNHFFIIKNDCSCSYYKKDYVASSCHSVILHLVHFTLCIRFVSSQTLQSLNKFILKNINYITKYIYYETIFHNESNNIDLALGILIVLSISLVKVEIL